jgi:hypothetical protein
MTAIDLTTGTCDTTSASIDTTNQKIPIPIDQSTGMFHTFTSVMTLSQKPSKVIVSCMITDEK